MLLGAFYEMYHGVTHYLQWTACQEHISHALAIELLGCLNVLVDAYSPYIAIDLVEMTMTNEFNVTCMPIGAFA